MHPIVYLLDSILGLLNIMLIIWLVIHALLHLNILNYSSEIVYKMTHALSKLLNPILRKIRAYLPYLGGIDISPLVLMLLISFTRYTLRYYFA